MTVLRYDNFELTLESPIKTSEGYLIVEGVSARAGVLEYQQENGRTIRELVLPEELSSHKAIESLKYRPVTVEHPPQFLTIDNAKDYSVGKVVDVEYLPSGYQKVRMVIDDPEGIEAIESGLRELSVGYRVEIVEEGGFHEIYGQFDQVQKNRIGNHVAITEAARAGSIASIRVDSKLAVSISSKESSMRKRRDERREKLDELEEIRQERDALQEELDSAKGEIEALRADLDERKTDEDELVGRLEALEALMGEDSEEDRDDEDRDDEEEDRDDEDDDREDEEEDRDDEDDDREDEEEGKKDTFSEMELREWYNERRELEDQAADLRIDEEEISRMTNDEIKRAIVEDFLGEDRRLDSAAQVDGAYRVIRTRLDSRKRSIKKVNVAMGRSRGSRKSRGRRGRSTTRFDQQSAELTYKERLANAWRNKD